MKTKNQVSITRKILYGIMTLGLIFSAFCVGNLPAVHASSTEANQYLVSKMIPSGFNQIRSDIGVALYKKDYTGGQPDYVQIVDLLQGASVKLLAGNMQSPGIGGGGFGGNNPTFTTTSLSTAWDSFNSSNSGAFCISNGAFFSMTNPAPLAFALKQNGTIVSDGYAGSSDPAGPVEMLELWGDHADIRSLTRDNLYASSAPNILGGLSENANKSMSSYVGRTFVGIDDSNGDGTYDKVLVFNSSYSRQIDASTVLRNFGADKVIMFDGGGSTQLRCGGTSYVSSTRPIPQTIGVLRGGGGGGTCPSVSGIVRLFDGQNCGTPSIDAGLGLTQLEQNNFNDKAESIAIPSGWSARLYQNNNENSSESACFSGTDTNLNDNTYVNGGGVGNNTTWMRVYNNSSCSDNTIPNTPPNFRTSGSTQYSVTIAWDDVSNESGYQIYKWNGSTATFDYLTSVGANTTSYTETRSSCGWDEYYEVSAYNSYGESTHANWVHGYSQACPPTSVCTWSSYTAPTSPTFGDVPMNATYWSWVERLSNAGITAGCGGGNFCPLTEVNRASMAIFLLRGKYCGSGYTPPSIGGSSGFNDVPVDASYAPWVKQLAADGITAGCGSGNFCPGTIVNRASMAIFLLRAKHGGTYTPPSIGGSSGFNDVPVDASYAPWVKQLAAEGITAGCGNGNFCPADNVNRASMAIFLVRAFGLP